MNHHPPMPVILFDGECALCQRVVRGLLRLDGEARMRFAPLQGAAGQAFLRARGLPTDDFDSLVFVPDWDHAASGEYLMRTDGLIGALKVCGGIGAELAAILAVWPTGWRDAGYRWVARSRHRIFGEWTPRPLARPEWAARFLP